MTNNTKANIHSPGTLHLNLKRKWFDMILSGEKTEEYRSFSPYWFNRLVVKTDHIPNPIAAFNWRSFDTITFSNGYAANRDQFIIELKSIYLGEGLPVWGALENTPCFIFMLGSIKSVKSV